MVQIGTGPQNFVSVVVGLYHLGALLETGEVFMWGYNSNGQLGIGAATVGSSTLISPTLSIFPSGTFLTSLAVGALHSGAIDNNTTLWTWGRNSNGQLGIGSDIDHPLPISVGTGYTVVGMGLYHTCATKGSNLYCWGQDNMCETTDTTPVQHSDNTPHLVPVLYISKPAVQIVGGNQFTVVLLSDGTVWSWGDSNDDELGQGSTTVHPHCKPRKNTLLSNATAISAGDAQGCALLAGNVYCWGSNYNGELGDGHSHNPSYNLLTPTMVAGVNSLSDISTSSDQTYALWAGSLFGWGSDQHCELLNVTGNKGDADTPKHLSALTGKVILISKGCFSLMACAVTE